MVRSLMKVSSTIILNDEKNHLDEIVRNLKSADRFQCIVAFAKRGGLDEILPAIEKKLRSGMTARFVVGLDYYHTDPSLLHELLKLTRKYNSSGNRKIVELFMSSEEAEYTFHPKIYLFESSSGTSAIVGSANLTFGGLANNHEISLSAHEATNVMVRAVNGWISGLQADNEIVEATLPLVQQYEERHAVHRAHMKLAARRANRELASRRTKPEATELGTLAEILRETRLDKTDAGFEAQIHSRATARAAAEKLLIQIRDEPSLSEDRFKELYEPLVSGLWHSGGLHRGKNIIAGNATAFQTALRSVGDIRHLDVEPAFAALHGGFTNVNRAGINVITEILHTFDNDRFAVMNQNSVYSMTLANVVGFPAKPNKGNVDAKVYATFCAHADTIRNELKIKNFTELDALFNYAYWD